MNMTKTSIISTEPALSEQILWVTPNTKHQTIIIVSVKQGFPLMENKFNGQSQIFFFFFFFWVINEKSDSLQVINWCQALFQVSLVCADLCHVCKACNRSTRQRETELYSGRQIRELASPSSTVKCQL